MRAKIGRLEQELSSVQGELDRMRARPALLTQREDYVIGEMEIVNRQLECEYICYFALERFPTVLICWSDTIFAGFVSDFMAEHECVDE